MTRSPLLDAETDGMAIPTTRSEPSPLLWLWTPPAVLALSIGVKIFDEWVYQVYVLHEHGWLENTTLLLLLVAVLAGSRLFRSLHPPAPVWLKWWVLIITLGAAFFLGEEASWGQHLFGWGGGGEWSRLNQQEETNLHNLTAFGFIFDQLPRNLLTAAALVGGVVVPLYRRVRRLRWTPSESGYWLWPTLVCTPAAFLGVFVSVPEKLFDALRTAPPELLETLNPGELKECFLAFFIMLYLLSLRSRAAAAAPRKSG